ncbi:MAG TPA: DUF2796 domain-containing protein [Gemmatimonadaceae bacterium]|nr:DUF2796 domain-containing protein [Gemmatimonadaceae bacterium]
MRLHPALFAILTLLGATSTRASAQSRPTPKAHTHGLATLDIAIEGRTGVLRFSAPAEDIYGFERAPRTPAERQQREAALARLRTRFAELVIFEASLGCRITSTSLTDAVDRAADHDRAQAAGRDHDHEHDNESGHAEVTADYALACTRPPAGRDIRFGITRAFPAVRTVQVQLLSDDRQEGRRIERDRGTVRP